MINRVDGSLRGREAASWSIREALPSDVDFLKTLSELVFSIYGNYGVLLPRWMRFPEVTTIIAEASHPAGFIMFADIPFSVEEESYFADILAIAVHPDYHRRGVGRSLLGEVVARVERTAKEDRVTAIRLTVADTNIGARALFEQSGFKLLTAEEGRYEGGQRALRMERPVPLAG